jgi:uncharacterized protein with GYD domain
MLFVVTHVHPPELCPSDNPELVKKTVSIVASKAHAEKCGVKVLGSYIAPPEHVLFFIIESDDYGKIVDFLRPIMKMGTPRIVPVSVMEDVKSKFE